MTSLYGGGLMLRFGFDFKLRLGSEILEYKSHFVIEASLCLGVGLISVGPDPLKRNVLSINIEGSLSHGCHFSLILFRKGFKR
jgi:hypothetical protein